MMTPSFRLLFGPIVFLLLLIAVFTGMAQLPQYASGKPPIAQSRPVVDEYFGNKIADPYRWMEAGTSDPEFLQFLKVQNDYTHKVLTRLASSREKLLNRLRELDNAAPAVGNPTRAGESIFFLQTNSGARTGSLMA